MSDEKIIYALQFVSPVDRDVWVMIGFAIKHELGEFGFDCWDQWSQQAQSYNARSAKSVWKSISTAGKTGIGTLFHMAKQNGWIDTEKYQEPTPQERERRSKERLDREARDRVELQRKQDGYKRAAERAASIIKTCKPGNHNYLRSKGLQDTIGLVMPEFELFVPMRSIEDNRLVGGQVIRWLMNEREWEKKMLPGMRAKGAVLRLGGARPLETWLVEGWVTGLSLEAAMRRLNLNAAVLVCFSAHNLVHIASLTSGRRFIFADNDASGTGKKVAEQAGLPFCMSPVLGYDANDHHVKFGLLALCGLIMEARRQI